METRHYAQYEIEQLKHIVATHDPNDPCQRVVLESAQKALAGELYLNPIGLLYLTNGAAGYDCKRSPNLGEQE